MEVYYYPDKQTKKLADRFWDGNGTPGDSIGEAHTKRKKFYKSIDFDIEPFRGTRDQFLQTILTSIHK